jgi:pilus assembly protein CpaF
VVKADHLEDLVRLGTLTGSAARFLVASVVAGLNILVAGGTQAGKMTMLNCLSSAIPSRERVVTCEEVFELKIPHRTRSHAHRGMERMFVEADP